MRPVVTLVLFALLPAVALAQLPRSADIGDIVRKLPSLDGC